VKGILVPKIQPGRSRGWLSAEELEEGEENQEGNHTHVLVDQPTDTQKAQVFLLFMYKSPLSDKGFMPFSRYQYR
jgi:hypothetical protein